MNRALEPIFDEKIEVVEENCQLPRFDTTDEIVGEPSYGWSATPWVDLQLEVGREAGEHPQLTVVLEGRDGDEEEWRCLAEASYAETYGSVTYQHPSLDQIRVRCVAYGEGTRYALRVLCSGRYEGPPRSGHIPLERMNWSGRP